AELAASTTIPLLLATWISDRGLGILMLALWCVFDAGGLAARSALEESWPSDAPPPDARRRAGAFFGGASVTVAIVLGTGAVELMVAGGYLSRGSGSAVAEQVLVVLLAIAMALGLDVAQRVGRGRARCYAGAPATAGGS